MQRVLQVCLFPDALLCLVDVLKDQLALLKKTLSLGGQCDLSAKTVEQSGIKFFLQQPYLHRHCGLGIT